MKALETRLSLSLPLSLSLSLSLYRRPVGERGGRVLLPGNLRDRKERSVTTAFSLYGSYVRGTWREGSFTENSESYVNFKKGSFYGIRGGNLEEGLLD